MRPRTYSSEGIVLARRNYSEADRILVIYTKKYGKLSLIAKGVRKLKSRKRGSLQIFSHIKFSAARGKNLDIVTETEIINSFSKVRKDLKKVSVAYFFVETAGRLTRDEVKNVELFNTLIKYLRRLETEAKLKILRLDFIHKLLSLLGFWPKNRPLKNPDAKLEEVVEREMNSVRVGKKILV